MNAQSPARSLPARIGGRERGTAGLEAAALLPLIILFGFVVFQVGVAMWTIVETDTAVRSAARAAGRNPDNATSAALDAARGSLPRVLAVVPGTPTALPNGIDGYTVTLGVKIPRWLALGPSTVTRHADMPITK